MKNFFRDMAPQSPGLDDDYDALPIFPASFSLLMLEHIPLQTRASIL